VAWSQSGPSWAGGGETVVNNKKLLSTSIIQKLQLDINPLTNEQNKKTRTIKLINASVRYFSMNRTNYKKNNKIS